MKRSTKTTDRNQAYEVAIELERVERSAKQGELTTAQLRKVLNDVSVKVNGDSLAVPTTEDYLNTWLEGIKARNTPATRERYGNAVKQFLDSLKAKAKKPLNTINAHDVEAFLNARLKSGLAPKTVIVDLKILKTAFRRAVDYNTINQNPVTAVQLPKEVSSEREVFTNDEIEKILAATPSVEWQTLILLGYFVGARLRDCVQLKWENIDADKGIITYEQQKTGKKVIVPMHLHIIEHLKFISAFGTTGFLCPKLAAKGPGGKHGLSESFKRIALKAGLDLMTAKGKGTRQFSKRTFHSLRHSFNSHLANAGVPEEVRMRLTGHSSKVMNARYTHLETKTLKSAMTNMPVFGQKKPPV